MIMIYQICMVAALAMGGFSAVAGPQQEKMKACNQQAVGKTGEARKAFMKTCLSGAADSPAVDKAKMTPQERMKYCSSEGKGKKGDERKAFMSECLKAK
jgi:hypothetical protein